VSAEPLGLRERGKQQRVDRILTAALDLLREEGAVTTERLAERAEVAPMTIFNLVGNREQLWTAMIDRALAGLDVTRFARKPPQERARAIAREVARILAADGAVFRALLAQYSATGHAFAGDPTHELVACLRAAAEEGTIDAGANVRRLGELLSAGLLGVIQQWATGLISDRELGRRAVDIVDLVFAAARPD
jgi:AcrR family transcriptional regulator